MTFFDRESNTMRTISGLFHQWGMETTGDGRSMVSRTVAIVEDINTHEIVMAVPNRLVFEEAEENERVKKANEFKQLEPVASAGLQIPEFLMSGRKRVGTFH